MTSVQHLRLMLEKLPLRPTSFAEYRVIRLYIPNLSLGVFYREAMRDRCLKQKFVGNRNENLKAYVEKTHKRIVAKNIEALKLRRSELLYCSKRARPISLHK